MFLCYYYWIIANNFRVHSTITAKDYILEQVDKLENKERAVAGANLFEADYTLPFQIWCLYHTG